MPSDSLTSGFGASLTSSTTSSSTLSSYFAPAPPPPPPNDTADTWSIPELIT